MAVNRYFTTFSVHSQVIGNSHLLNLLQSNRREKVLLSCTSTVLCRGGGFVKEHRILWELGQGCLEWLGWRGEEQRDNLFSTALLTLSFGEISFPSHAFHTLDQLSLSWIHLASFLWLPSGFLPQLPHDSNLANFNPQKSCCPSGLCHNLPPPSCEVRTGHVCTNFILT